MKERELRQHAHCTLCRQLIGASRVPLFWRVTVERFVLQVPNLQRQDGLTALLGGHAGLAQVMGTDAEMATPGMPPTVLTVCETCAAWQALPVAVLGLEYGRTDSPP